jgi:hypothetical protein
MGRHEVPGQASVAAGKPDFWCHSERSEESLFALYRNAQRDSSLRSE